jgi:pyruvate dehydrogenase E1 component alpha subunit
VVAECTARPPLAVARGRILERALATGGELDAIWSDAVAQVDRAEAFARRSPYPELEEAFTDVYSD